MDREHKHKFEYKESVVIDLCEMLHGGYQKYGQKVVVVLVCECGEVKKV